MTADSSSLRQTIAAGGWSGAFTDITIRALNHCCSFQILKCIFIGEPQPEFLTLSAEFQARFLSAEELLTFAAFPANKLPEAFVREALAKGDECFGILEGERLASYGWYSNKPTEIGDGGLAIHFDPRFIYMYKGYTHNHYRGKRLHAIGMTMALKAYRERGLGGIVSYVAANNFASLKSCYRMGYQDFGSVLVAQHGKFFLAFHTPGCGRYGVKIRRM
ncbi:MAG: hypothetical protein SFV51_12645 [Bryobacteraceae bacterium]|nr:hypothetical protein [Bryobacteraceae bacterium]